MSDGWRGGMWAGTDPVRLNRAELGTQGCHGLSPVKVVSHFFKPVSERRDARAEKRKRLPGRSLVAMEHRHPSRASPVGERPMAMVSVAFRATGGTATRRRRSDSHEHDAGELRAGAEAELLVDAREARDHGVGEARESRRPAAIGRSDGPREVFCELLPWHCSWITGLDRGLSTIRPIERGSAEHGGAGTRVDRQRSVGIGPRRVHTGMVAP